MIVAFERPAIDWHALAPEIVLLSVGVLITLLDILFLEKARPYMAALSGLGIIPSYFGHDGIPLVIGWLILSLVSILTLVNVATTYDYHKSLLITC